ncbi:Folliculin-interacting protein 1 [Acipenser ruthenus]|uniref:Folliculin-interacting protein 1 n=1 Tax=Acipenser ruthenus TaxID=7906 RepID=A0A444U6N6_ACIRT|nr:Folliculin-interacting protein 1 [Acipenser ruthenus]
MPSWTSPKFDPSQIRLIVYQDCERRGRNVLFDSNAKKKMTEETPVSFDPSQIRLIVYQDCERRGRNVLFDSNAKKKMTEETPVSKLCSDAQVKVFGKCCQLRPAGGSSSSLDSSSSSSTASDSKEQGHKHQGSRCSSDANMLGEMMFGSVAMSYKGSTLKIHQIRSPPQLMLSKVFTARTGSSVYGSLNTLQDSLEFINQDSNTLKPDHNSGVNGLLGNIGFSQLCSPRRAFSEQGPLRLIKSASFFSGHSNPMDMPGGGQHEDREGGIARSGDLYGAIGSPVRLSRTVVVGKKQDLVQRLLYFLTYFIRCSELQENRLIENGEDEAIVMPGTLITTSLQKGEVEDSDYVLVTMHKHRSGLGPQGTKGEENCSSENSCQSSTHPTQGSVGSDNPSQENECSQKSSNSALRSLLNKSTLENRVLPVIRTEDVSDMKPYKKMASCCLETKMETVVCVGSSLRDQGSVLPAGLETDVEARGGDETAEAGSMSIKVLRSSGIPVEKKPPGKHLPSTFPSDDEQPSTKVTFLIGDSMSPDSDTEIRRQKHPVLDEPIAEAVCIVADVEKWTVQVASSQRRMPENKLGQEVLVSSLVSNLLQSTLQLYKLNLSPNFCIMHLEDRLQELYFKSKMLSEYLKGQTRVHVKELGMVLGWTSPKFDPSQIRLIVYQDCERRGRNVLFDSNAKKKMTEETPVSADPSTVVVLRRDFTEAAGDASKSSPALHVPPTGFDVSPN